MFDGIVIYLFDGMMVLQQAMSSSTASGPPHAGDDGARASEPGDIR